MTTLTDAMSFVQDHADESDLTHLMSAMRARRQILDQRRAATVTVGATVRLDGLRPQYLNGLTGEVMALPDGRARIKLDEKSTQDLRFAGRKYHVPADVTNYELGGVPLPCCIVD